MNKPVDATNVVSRRFGEGTVDGMGNNLDDFLVATMPLPWELTRDRLGGRPRAVLMADSMERDVLDEQVRSAPEVDVVVAIGGGRASDLGIYLMARLQENRPREITQYMNEVGLRYHPSDMQLTMQALEEALLGLGRYAQGRPDLWYTVIQERVITPAWVAAACQGLK